MAEIIPLVLVGFGLVMNRTHGFWHIGGRFVERAWTVTPFDDREQRDVVTTIGC